MKLTLVTGAAGFIGSNAARAFCAAGHRVVGCDRLRNGIKWRNLADIPLHDLITPEDLPAWLARHGADIAQIIHLGAVSSTLETNADRILKDNIRATLDLWAWCSEAQIPFLYASSAATYGDGAQGFSDDDSADALARLHPLNAYGWSKHFADRRIAADVAAGRPVPPHWAGLKFFNVYGPGEDHKAEMRSLVNKLMPIARSGGTVKLFRSYRDDYEDGGQMRDFVYIDDVIDAITWLAGATHVNGLFNLGSGIARSWNDLAVALFKALNLPAKIDYCDMPPEIRPQYQYFTEAPMQKLRAAGWHFPATTLEDGVARYVAAKSPGNSDHVRPSSPENKSLFASFSSEKEDPLR